MEAQGMRSLLCHRVHSPVVDVSSVPFSGMVDRTLYMP